MGHFPEAFSMYKDEKYILFTKVHFCYLLGKLSKEKNQHLSGKRLKYKNEKKRHSKELFARNSFFTFLCSDNFSNTIIQNCLSKHCYLIEDNSNMIDFKLKTDDELISSFVSGCNEAFDCLIERYDSEVLSYIRLSVADWDDANDIFQEVFIKVINTIREGRYQMQGKFRSWLLRIAHNAIIDYFRRAKAQKTISLSNDIYREDFIERIPCSSPNIEELLIANNTRQEVREWVAQLPKQQREVLILRFSQEMSFKEIAEYTGVSINTALGRMRYALINLRKIALKERAFAQ